MIVVGSHLDSVIAGAGINDNGSGSSANLELAIAMSTVKLPIKNKILFAWWASEEFGLLGSKYFVKNLTQAERLTVALNLNFDMLGSPNFQRGIYNGSSGNETIRVGSGKIQGLFESYFRSQGLLFDLIDFNGRSDYGPFIEVGIPAGGIAAGAEVIKTAVGRDKFGGYANAPFDPCYHQACDTVKNVDGHGYIQMAQAAAYTLGSLSLQDDLKNYLINP